MTETHAKQILDFLADKINRYVLPNRYISSIDDLKILEHRGNFLTFFEAYQIEQNIGINLNVILESYTGFLDNSYAGFLGNLLELSSKGYEIRYCEYFLLEHYFMFLPAYTSLEKIEIEMDLANKNV